jgi:Ca2+/Na+ antiporter
LIYLVVLFYMLGACAETYFCPSLGVLADRLKLSPDVAVCIQPLTLRASATERERER